MKKVLIVVDMQNDFIDGALGTAHAQAIVPKVREKILERQRQGYEVCYTQDTHNENYLNTQEGKKLPIKHCIWGTPGWEIHSTLPKIDSNHIINKSSFGYPYWLSDLYVVQNDREKPSEIELCGLCTDICVISNAMILKSSFPEANIIVDASCCAGTTLENHQNALKAMKMCQINIVGD